MNNLGSAKWIMDQRFNGLQPIDVYHKELAHVEPSEHSEALQNVHTLVRKTFVLEEHVSEALLQLTADDYYKVYVNGQFVGQGPAQSNYYHYYYNKYDVSEYLQQGDNIIAVHVYYHGLISRSYNSGDYRQGLLAELSVNGSTQVHTDKTWKYTTAEEYGPTSVIGYNTQFLENIDSRLQLNGWRERGFDDSGWLFAWEHLEDDHLLVLQPTPTLSVYEIKPQQVKRIDEGYLIDFGHEITGQFTMKAHGQSGQTIEVRCGEELLPDQRVRYQMRCNCTYQEIWTLSGERDELEFYDYKAFRYVEVIAEDESALQPETFAAIVRHYPLDEKACQFESSNPLLNSIWSICANGITYGTQENYVDCPSREKGQYLGDNTVITHAHAYVSGDLRMIRKAIEDFALLSSRVCPGLMAVAPGHFMQEIADFSLQWPMQLLQYYKLSGDREFLESMYPVAEQMMDYFDRYKRQDGLLDSVNDKWNLVDWPENARDGYDFSLKKGHIEGCHNVINAFYYGALQSMSDIREELQMPRRDDLEVFCASFRHAFYRPDQKLFVDAEGSEHASLHANVLPLLFGLAPEEAVTSIVGLIRTKRFSCGVYMAYFVLKALAAAKEYELLYDLIVSDDLHSWGNMVKEGATTCYEAWSKELKWNTSLCHPWASAPIPLFIEEIVGLKPASPGWEKVSFEPHLPDSLREIRLSFRVPAGEVQFELKDGLISLNVPEGVAVVKQVG
ncbi:family 78 glycoside hydrolase catalytic domain [Paenibacillus sp. UNC451MF]|uniref:family 78 glycoside hydrolase catalytic domain n=1 Tax=Paenibacillus sp. UNC451MF TaxID=1449063 RepID=UPI001E51F383|nr:family 78 glycoside hydrolase catalytic domain [Paenibacillus sp. UNC451MF]